MYQVTERVLTERSTAVARRRLEQSQINGWIGTALREVVRAVEVAALAVTGPPFARYLPVEGAPDRYDVEVGFPVEPAIEPSPDGGVQPSRLPGGQAAVLVHEGAYDVMAPAYEALAAWIAERGGVVDEPSWENYLTLPLGPPQTWRTEIVQPWAPA